jgi:hypothetical protein
MVSRRPPKTAMVLHIDRDAEVRKWIDQLMTSRSSTKRMQLATKICTVLAIEIRTEEEMFYTDFVAAAEYRQLEDALLDRDGTQQLIAALEAADTCRRRNTCCGACSTITSSNEHASAANGLRHAPRTHSACAASVGDY